MVKDLITPQNHFYIFSIIIVEDAFVNKHFLYNTYFF